MCARLVCGRGYWVEARLKYLLLIDRLQLRNFKLRNLVVGHVGEPVSYYSWR